MEKQQIRNNATTFQLPLILPRKSENHGISTIKANTQRYKIRNNKTLSSIQFNQLEQFKIPKSLTSHTTTSNNRLKNYNKQKNDENVNHDNLIDAKHEYEKILFSPSFISKVNNPDSYIKKGKIAVKSTSLPRNGRNIISIRIENNWEKDPTITMYFIALFDKKKRQINSKNNNIYIASIPEPSSLIKLENLLDSSYIKEEKKNFFCEFFNQEKFTIMISIDQSIEIGSILVFNPPTKSKSAVKDISIFLNENFCFKGQIPQDFGINMKFDNQFINEQTILPKLEQNDEENRCVIPINVVYYDNYGILPIKPVKEIKIEIIETYNCAINIGNNFKKDKFNDNNYIGVNGFDFFDILGNLIPNQTEDPRENCYQYINEVNIRGIADIIRFGMLLKENKVTNNRNEMFLGQIDHIQYPSFNFVFNRPIYLSKILIWNFNGYGDNLNFGIKKLKVYTNNKLVWFGKIPCGSGQKEDKVVYSIKLWQPNMNINEFKV